jgi:ubiquinone/menaquinone biosynthesis C-methylase UbiE
METELSSAQPNALNQSMSFGQHASAYSQYRPTYPIVAVRWALADLVQPGSDDLRGLRILDLAAGTGKLTEALVALRADLLAVEPDPQMLAELNRRLPHVQSAQGRAEQIPASDHGFDAVVVGDAFHWFDQTVALTEIARVLRPGGVVAALWNFDDVRVPWVAGLAESAVQSRDLELWQRGQNFADHAEFRQPERTEFDYPQQMTTDGLLTRMATRAIMLTMDERERTDTLNRVRAFLDDCPETASATFELPTVTGVDRARRIE